ncbi:MAG: hypothetical protein ACTH2Y_10795 [Corynebacterium sp.]|uniref:hypothetical protein n=1 Tax=unclassified Corynebacterium TaxID=2624378 RepID=UPI003F91F9F9
MSLSHRVKISLTAAVITPTLVLAPNAVAADLPGSGDTSGSLGSLSSLGSLGSSGSGTTPEDPDQTTYPDWIEDLLSELDGSPLPPLYLIEIVKQFNEQFAALTPEEQEEVLDLLRELGYLD